MMAHFQSRKQTPVLGLCVKWTPSVMTTDTVSSLWHMPVSRICEVEVVLI